MSPRLAVVAGLAFIAMGVYTVLGGMGVVAVRMSPDLQGSEWVVVCAGVIIVLLGLALIFSFAAQSAGSAAGEPAFTVRLISYLLGFGIVGLFTVVFTWIAAGPGPRNFSSAISTPLMTQRTTRDEISGRVIFGASAALCWIFFISSGISGARQLMRSRRAG